MALAALVNVCQQQGIVAIDCQQKTSHLALMGAQEMAREEFLNLIRPALALEQLDWSDQEINWDAWRSQGSA
jgi:leucyl/phenylalanyl-tRNA--protein transferase